MYGKEIKEVRTIKGITQNEVSKATGLPQNTISWIELDKGIPNIQQCVQLAKFYGCTLDELVGLSDATPTMNATPAKLSDNAVAFNNEFNELFSDKNYISVSKLFKAAPHELRALALGYLIGLFQSNGVNTQKVLGY